MQIYSRVKVQDLEGVSMKEEWIISTVWGTKALHSAEGQDFTLRD